MTFFENSYAEVDVSGLPLVQVFVVGPIRDDSYGPYLEALLQAIQMRERVILRMHAGPLTAFPARFVRMSADWMKANRATLESHTVATAIVMQSSLLRMATQALVWASRPPFPMQAMRNRKEADAWLLAQLKQDAS
tara:strand:+ start:54230 stop:54637 length:408 start_codon:yes stop_codon:yes gene_type:complete